MEMPTDMEVAMRASQELKGFEVDVSKYDEDALRKIVSLFMVYQSARERMLRRRK